MSNLARTGRVIGAVAAGLVAVAALSAPALAATGKVNTAGTPLTVRSSPSTSASAVGSHADGATITIDCQTTGTSVTGTYGTSKIWDHIPSKGSVSDTYVYTGSDGMVAPECGGGSSGNCSASGISNPRTCAQAVAWAKAHYTTTYHSDYYRRCDHIMGLAYGRSASGHVSAAAHWAATPSRYRHSGRAIPGGGLAYFRTGQYGHVAISLGDGRLMSNDIHGNGTFTYTTISEIEHKWGAGYLGWSNPWF